MPAHKCVRSDVFFFFSSRRRHTRFDCDWSSDVCSSDLEAPFTDVVTVAQAVKALCDDIGLPAGIKTSGSTGLHVLIPLGRQVTYEQSRTLGGLLARVIAAPPPHIATLTRPGQKRGGEGYLD